MLSLYSCNTCLRSSRHFFISQTLLTNAVPSGVPHFFIQTWANHTQSLQGLGWPSQGLPTSVILHSQPSWSTSYKAFCSVFIHLLSKKKKKKKVWYREVFEKCLKLRCKSLLKQIRCWGAIQQLSVACTVSIISRSFLTVSFDEHDVKPRQLWRRRGVGNAEMNISRPFIVVGCVIVPNSSPTLQQYLMPGCYVVSFIRGGVYISCP